MEIVPFFSFLWKQFFSPIYILTNANLSFCFYLGCLFRFRAINQREASSLTRYGLNFPRQSATTMKHRAKNTVKYSSVEWSTHFTGRNDQDSHGNVDGKKWGTSWSWGRVCGKWKASLTDKIQLLELVVAVTQRCEKFWLTSHKSSITGIFSCKKLFVTVTQNKLFKTV